MIIESIPLLREIGQAMENQLATTRGLLDLISSDDISSTDREKSELTKFLKDREKLQLSIVQQVNNELTKKIQKS